jgi:uncharacterized membrane protein YfcA
MEPGMIGGIIGGVFGMLGGAVGAYFSIKNTNGPRERAFMVRVCFVAFVAVISLITLMYFLPKPWAFLLWIPYVIALLWSIVYCNRTQQRIRNEESGQ